MPAATARPRPSRPASARGGAGNRSKVAYDLGRAGEDAPGWLGDHPSYEPAYNRGVDERDAAAAGAPPRQRARRVETTPAPEASTSSGDSASAGAGRDDGSSRDGPIPDRAPQTFRRRIAGAARSDAGTAGSRVSLGVDDGAGLIFGAIAYALFVNAVRSPTSAAGGIKAWFRAKFFNITTAAPAPDRASALALSTLLVGPLVSAPETIRKPVLAPPPASAHAPGAWIGSFLLGGTPAPKPPPPAGGGG